MHARVYPWSKVQPQPVVNSGTDTGVTGSAPLMGGWMPEDMDVFVQSAAAYEEAIACVARHVVDRGGTGYHVAREPDRYGWPMNFEGESFDPQEACDEEGEPRDEETPYGFAPMAPFPTSQVLLVARGKALGERYGEFAFGDSRGTELSKELFAGLAGALRKLPTSKESFAESTVGEPRSYGLHTSVVLEIVRHRAHPVCTAPPTKPLKISWMSGAARAAYKPLLRVNIILIGSRAAYRAMPEYERYCGAPAWGTPEHRIPPCQIAGEFDMQHCGVAMLVDATLRPRFVHSDAALRCATEGRIEFTPYAFCSEDIDRTNAIRKVLARTQKYVERGFKLPKIRLKPPRPNPELRRHSN